MAKIKRSVKITFDEEFEAKLIALGKHSDEILEKAMDAGAKAALPVVRDNLKSAIGRGNQSPDRSTGELLETLGVSPVMVDRNGITNVKIGFYEPRRHQYPAKRKRSYYTITNAMIANVLEYGKHGQPPRPWLKRAKTQATKVFRAKMQEVIDEEVEKL